MAASVWIMSTLGARGVQGRPPALEGDDADGHAVPAEAERVADRHHPLADLDLLGVAEVQER